MSVPAIKDKNFDFAGNGCVCTCDCVGGTEDCTCFCVCENPEDEDTVAAHKMMEETRRLRLERRRLYYRELQEEVSSMPSVEQTQVELECITSDDCSCTDLSSDLEGPQCAKQDAFKNVSFTFQPASCSTSANN